MVQKVEEHSSEIPKENMSSVTKPPAAKTLRSGQNKTNIVPVSNGVQERSSRKKTSQTENSKVASAKPKVPGRPKTEKTPKSNHEIEITKEPDTENRKRSAKSADSIDIPKKKTKPTPKKVETNVIRRPSVKRKKEATCTKSNDKDKVAQEAVTNGRKRLAKSASNAEVPVKKEKVSSRQVKTAAAVLRKPAVRKKKELLKVPKLPTISGVLFVIGSNDCAQLGLEEGIYTKERPSELDFPCRFVDIAAGALHSVCLTDRGEVYTFGCNDEGALGRNTDDGGGSEYKAEKVEIPGVVVKVSAGDSHSAALTETGQVYIWGNFRGNVGFLGLLAPGKKEPRPVQLLPNITCVNIASGGDHFVCLSNEGVVYTCGCAEVGQLGRVAERSSTGNTRRNGLSMLLEPHAVPVRNGSTAVSVADIWTGTYNTFVKAQATGEIYGFGLNNCHQLGFGGVIQCFWPERLRRFPGNLQWKQIWGDQHHTLAMDGDGHIYTVGCGEYGRLGLGQECLLAEQPTVIPTLQNEECVDISTGSMCSFAVGRNGLAYSWGSGSSYQLGHGNDEDHFVPKPITGKLSVSWKVFRVSAGSQHTLLLANRKPMSEEKDISQCD